MRFSRISMIFALLSTMAMAVPTPKQAYGQHTDDVQDVDRRALPQAYGQHIDGKREAAQPYGQHTDDRSEKRGWRQTYGQHFNMPPEPLAARELPRAQRQHIDEKRSPAQACERKTDDRDPPPGNDLPQACGQHIDEKVKRAQAYGQHTDDKKPPIKTSPPVTSRAQAYGQHTDDVEISPPTINERSQAHGQFTDDKKPPTHSILKYLMNGNINALANRAYGQKIDDCVGGGQAYGQHVDDCFLRS
ncbi:hypothetical protein HYFRA_00010664 [Hymenoscyphus fraxineus]|uniref:Uncharacterized protein n=1 Tax=Hymenoscyphus fraxineus TaxID=746836 RepID=A0A9N9PYA3_9HELO|nr:hypothetical protein HYFRA_00010664 [Hymenoscyphus fraxineus]